MVNMYDDAYRLWQDQASKDRALQALSSMSSAQIVSATAVQPVAGSEAGRSVLPPVLYPHMSPLGAQYPTYGASGVSHSLQVTCIVVHVVLAAHCLLLRM